MDKEVVEVMEEIEESLAGNSKREHWALSSDAQASYSHPARAVPDSLTG